MTEVHTEEQAILGDLEIYELSYHKSLRRAGICRATGKAAALASLIAAGTLITHSHKEKENVGLRLLTDIAALSVGGLSMAVGYGQSDERKLTALASAVCAVETAQELNIDAPSWAHQGLRIRAEISAEQTGVK